MAGPVIDSGFGTSEEVIDNRDLMSEEHQPIDQMRANKSSTARDEDALALGWRQKFDGWEAIKRGVRNGVIIGIMDSLGLVFFCYKSSAILAIWPFNLPEFSALECRVPR